MIFFLIVLSVAIIMGAAMLNAHSEIGSGFAAWMAFCFLAACWVTGLIVFVAHHFIVKYW